LVYRVLQENLETFLARQQDNGRYVARLSNANCALALRAKLMLLRNSISSVYRKADESWILNACGNRYMPLDRAWK